MQFPTIDALVQEFQERLHRQEECKTNGHKEPSRAIITSRNVYRTCKYCGQMYESKMNEQEAIDHRKLMNTTFGLYNQ